MHDGLEQLANYVNDQDREWGPFLFLRPEPHERMSSRRVLVLAVLYGLFGGLLVNAILVLTGRANDSFNPFVFPLGVTSGFFLVYRVVFAYGWNRRADRLSREVPAYRPRVD